MEYNRHMHKFYMTIFLAFLTSCTSLESIGAKGGVDKDNVHFVEVNESNFSLFTKNLSILLILNFCV